MLDLSSFWKNISNLSIFIMAGGGVHPAGNPWSRSLKSFQHKIVHLMSKNSKLSTWCQKSSKLSTWYQKIQNCSPDVHNTEILGAYNQSRHTTWTVIPMHYWQRMYDFAQKNPFVISSEGQSGIFQSECHISGCGIVNYGTYEKRQHKIFCKSKYTINYSLGSVTILPSGGQHHWVPSQQVEEESL